MNDINPDFFRDRFCDDLGVASQEDSPNSKSMECSHRLFGFRSQRVCNLDGTEINAITGDQYLRRGVTNKTRTVKNNVVALEKRAVSNQNPSVIRTTIDALTRNIFKFFG